MTLGERLFRALLHLLPGDFGGDYAEAMLADARAGGPRWWTVEIPGEVAAIAREHADVLRQDLKYTFRMMRRTPGFTAVAIVMLALGTGVNAAMFSVIDAVMLRSPFGDAASLAMARTAKPDGTLGLVPVDRLRELETSAAVASVAIVGQGSHVLTAPGTPRVMDNVECVSGSMFDVLRAHPFMGRTFGADEDHPGAAPVIVLSYSFWQELGGAPSIVGAPLTINQTPVTVIGVMPKGFYGAQSRATTMGWLPIHRPIVGRDNTGCRSSATATVVARLRPGLTRTAAAARAPGFQFEALESVWMDSVRTPLRVLAAAVACVLLIACVNVGGLQMERTIARRRELSLRLALGASRGRLARQIIVENVAFALAGALAGFAAAAASMRALLSILPPNIPYAAEIALNERVLAAVIAAAVVAGIVSGLFPLMASRGISAGEDMVPSGRATARTTSWTRRSMAVAEVALSIVVLIGAALMIRTFITLQPAQPGFDPDRKLWQPVRLRGASDVESERFFRELFERLRLAPSITGAAGTTYVPMLGLSGDARIVIDGVPKFTLSNRVTPEYFDLMKIPVVAGRNFNAQDTAAATPVVIVNDLLAHRIRPDGRVVGERVTMDLTDMGLEGAPAERLVIGVIADTRGSGNDTRPRAEAYVPQAQAPLRTLTIITEYAPGRAAQAADSLRAALTALKPDLVLNPPGDLRDMVDGQVSIPRFGAWLLGVFAGLALLLAAIGLMTTIGWWVRLRTRELGVRMALGASRRQIGHLVGRQGMALAACGVLVGWGLAAGVTRYMASFIYGVTPGDTATFAGAGLGMLAVAALAIHVPLRRATRIDPVTALRSE